MAGIPRKRIILPTRNEFDNKYPILNIPVDFPLPPKWTEAFPPEDNEAESYKYVDGVWVDDLDWLKEEQKKKIKASRWTAERAGFDFNGVPINTDDTSQMKITGAVSAVLVDYTYTLDWKCDDGTFVQLTGDNIKALGRAVRDFVQAKFNKEKDYDALIDTKTTREDIASVVWEDA